MASSTYKLHHIVSQGTMFESAAGAAAANDSGLILVVSQP
jgi:hypothetical protein